MDFLYRFRLKALSIRGMTCPPTLCQVLYFYFLKNHGTV